MTKTLMSIIIFVGLLFAIVGGYYVGFEHGLETATDLLNDKSVSQDELDVDISEVTTFTQCAQLSGVVAESYPRQCRYNGKTFVENIGNELEKMDMIRLDHPRPNQKISSPLEVTGQARGNWFFEASFPVVLTNWDGLIIAQGVAQATDEWMTEDFVPFYVEIEFETPDYGDLGALILQKSNPSGMPENDDALEIPILFE
ncbi:hypothetical protein H6758_00900 [Candidatus Nomurabacteria bacterium]|nr:hypothetical protein [Candidatus Nomurabacteria bacterium]